MKRSTRTWALWCTALVLELLGASLPVAADEEGIGAFSVGRVLFSGDWAGIGQPCRVIVHNRSGQNATVRITNLNSSYRGQNWIHMTGDGLGDTYWQNHSTEGGLRFGVHYGTGTSYSVPANSDARLDIEGTSSGFQFNPYNFSVPSDTKAARYYYQDWGDAPTVQFEEMHTVLMERLVGGKWEPVGDADVRWGMVFLPTLVQGFGAFSNFSGKPIWLNFTIGGDDKPDDAREKVQGNPSPDAHDKPKQPEACGVAGKPTVQQNSVDLSFKLTGDNFGRYPAALRYFQSRIDKTVYDPRFLTVDGRAQVSTVFHPTTTAVLQFLTQNDVVVVDDPSSTDEKFVLDFYVRDPSWTAAPGSPLPVSGTPHTTVTIQNPDRTLLTHNRLNVTWVTAAKTEAWDYTYSAATSQWVMVSNDGTQIETVVYSSTATAGVTEEMRTVTDENGVLFSKVKTLWQNFDFGMARIEQTVDPDGKALKTSWSYYSNINVPSSFGRVSQRVDPSGAWINYSYHSLLPEVSKTVQGWLGAPSTAPESQCRVQDRVWNPTGTPAGTTLETEKLGGIVVSRRFIVEYSDGFDEIRCLTQSAAWNDAGNLVTKTRYCTDSVFRTKLKSVIRPDGTGMFYSYQIDGTTLDDATQLTTIVTDGALNGAATAVVDGTQTTTLTNKQGGVIFRQVSDIASGKLIDQRLASSVDVLGRPTSEQFLDGTTQQTVFGCCGIDSITDRRGIATVYADLTQSHATTRTSLGVTDKTRYSGLSVFESRIGSDNSEIQLGSTQYNLAGQVIGQSFGAGGSATLETVIDANGNTVTTTTYADGGTKVVTSYPDGTAKSVTGTAVAPVRFDYGVEPDGTQWTKSVALDAQGNDTQEWTRTWTDVAGRAYRNEQSGAGFDTVYFNGKGQVQREVDADGVAVLSTYDARGWRRRGVLDMNRNGMVDEGGTDAISQIDVAISNRSDGRNVERMTQTVWTTDNNAAATAVVGTVDRALDGLDSWSTVHGVTTQSHVAYAGNGAWTETVTSGDGATTVRDYTAGRLASETRKDATGAVIATTSYFYDAHGRVSQTGDGRGAVVFYGYDSANRLQTITGPAPVAGGVAPVTKIDYDNMGRRWVVTDPDGGTIVYGYYPTGAVHTIGGNRTYPVSFTYTAQGRQATMTTASGTTTWAYDPVTGRLWKKLDTANKGPVYLYTAAGRIATKTNARGTVAAYGYDNAGINTSISYDDGLTSAVSLTLNRLGQPLTIGSGNVTATMGFNLWGQLETESFSGGPVGGLAISHGYDALSRLSSVASVLGVVTLSSQGYGYDDASRLKSVIDGGNFRSATYAYDPNANLVTHVVLKEGAAIRLDSWRSFDLAGRLDWIKSLNAQGQSLFEANYLYDSIDQRTSAVREDGTQWAWHYNDRGEVKSGTKKFSDGTAHPQLQYGYAYDDIGNRTRSSKGVSAPDGPPLNDPHTSTYFPNALNRYTGRTNPPYLAISGEAAADANVVVQGGPVQRKGTTFWREWSVANDQGPVRENIRVAAAKPGAGTNGIDLASLQTGKLYLPPATESYAYDDDGNLLSDARWTYTWDAENRLLSMQEKPAVLPAGWARRKIDFGYDASSRRVRKTVQEWQGSAWQTVGDAAFVYDGWNLLAEVSVMGGSPHLVRSYAWGLDLSQSLQGAGGVGGLLWCTTADPSPVTHLPSYDGNGNVIGYVDSATGQASLKLDYDPFGNAVMAAPVGDSASGAVARAIPFRFSTKFTDRETGLCYYGYRYYSGELGRWISAEPLGEIASPNLNSILNNCLTNRIDVLGLYDPAGHFYTVYMAAIAAGRTRQQAFELAYYAQLPDQIHALDATTSYLEAHGDRVLDRLGLLSASSSEIYGKYFNGADINAHEFGRDVAQMIHSLNGLRGKELANWRECLRRRINDPAMKEWQRGFLLHALGDSYAHVHESVTPGFDRQLSFAEEALSYPDGHKAESLRDMVHGTHEDPDVIGNYPDRYRRYVKDLFTTLGGDPSRANLLAPLLNGGAIAISGSSNAEEAIEVQRSLAMTPLYGFGDSLLPAYEPKKWKTHSSLPTPTAKEVRDFLDLVKSACCIRLP